MTWPRERRRSLLVALLAVFLALAGCLGFPADGRPPADCSGDWSPSVEADDLALAPGENATVRIVATNVSGITYYSNSDLVRWVDFESLSPPADRSADSYPPQYFWEECTHVEVAALVSIPADAAPGEYTYGVHVIQNRSGRGDSMDRNFTVTVSET